jgi:hypothetical protein
VLVGNMEEEMLLTAMFKKNTHTHSHRNNINKKNYTYVWTLCLTNLRYSNKCHSFYLCYRPFQNLLGFRVYPWPNKPGKPSTLADLNSIHDRTRHSGLLCFWKEQNHFPLSCMRYLIRDAGQNPDIQQSHGIPYMNTFNTEGLLRMLSHFFSSRFLRKHL